MTLHPGGAMALFVLRLAGLLSLEKSLGENSTETSPNLTDTVGNLTFFYPLDNFTNNTDRPFLPSQDLQNSTNDETAPVASFLFEKEHNLESEDVAAANSRNGTSSGVVMTTDDFVIEEIQTDNDSLGFDDSANVEKRKSFQGLRKSGGQQNANEDAEEVKKGVENSRDIQQMLRQRPSKTNILRQSDITKSAQPGHSRPSTPTLPPRNRDTGFSPVYTKPLNNSAVLFTHLVAVTSSINAPRRAPLGSNSSSASAKQPSLEDGINQFRELQVARSDFVTSDREYFDTGGGMEHYPSPDYDPDLTSRSLISPVPRQGQEKSFLEYIKNEMEKKNGDTSNYNIVKVADNDKGSNNSSKTDVDPVIDGNPDIIDQNITSESPSVKNEISMNNENDSSLLPDISHQTRPTTKVPLRNNPYPYGPKILPEHVLKYNPNLRPKEDSKIPGSLFPNQNFLIDYDEAVEKAYDTDNQGGGVIPQGGTPEEERRATEDERERHEDKYLVKTEKPTVLFHFDKPGYSPKLPDASLPPTRAPTPSDPWDCSPRCPRYSLLDWNQDYDIRQYPMMTWISTVIIAENRILAELEGYMRVQDYFYGLNDRGQLLNMTVPFVTQIKHGRHPGVLKEFKDFTVSLYVNHIDDPLNYDLPTPISNEVLIDRLEAKTVFVSGFEANVWEVTESFLNKRASELMERLRQNGEAFLDRYFYLASYSRPELYQPVYYELWVYATSFRDSVLTARPLAPRIRAPPNKLTRKSISKLCRGVECPPFEVLRTYRYGIQKRRYFDGLFVTTSPGECQFTTLSVWKGFMPLHLYKHGINSHMEVIEATRPIGLVHIKEDSTSMTECPQNMTMAIYLPKRLHSNPPLTGYDAPSVSISALQDVVVYAYTVGGYLLEPGRVRKELSDLKHRLTEFGACFKQDEYYVVVYDFIIRYHGRQNEIWVVAENCKATLNG